MTWLNNAEVKTAEDQLEDARQSAISTTLAKIEEFGRRFTKDTPRIERDGWTIKAQAAMQLVNGDETPGMIHFEAQEKGVDRLVLAQKVLKKSQAYGGVCALITAIRSRTLDEIRAAQSYTELNDAMQRNFNRARERAKEFGVDFP